MYRTRYSLLCKVAVGAVQASLPHYRLGAIRHSQDERGCCSPENVHWKSYGLSALNETAMRRWPVIRSAAMCGRNRCATDIASCGTNSSNGSFAGRCERPLTDTSGLPRCPSSLPFGDRPLTAKTCRSRLPTGRQLLAERGRSCAAVP